MLSQWFAFGVRPANYFFLKKERRSLSQKQVAEVFRLQMEEGLSVRAIADIFGVSHMTVHRALSNPIYNEMMEI